MLLVTYDGNYWYPALYDLDSSFGTTYDGMLLDDYNYIDRIEFNLLYNRILKKIYFKYQFIRYSNHKYNNFRIKYAKCKSMG